MKPQSTISVIIPTYNRAKYIAEAVQSVLDQKAANFELEVIVVDDGSTDNTKAVLKQFGDKIIYKRVAHKGRPAPARNVGLRLAKGDLIALLDSDDLWVANKLSLQLPVFDDPSVIFSFGNAQIMNEGGEKLAATVINKKQLGSLNRFEQLLEANFISTLTVMFRRSVLDKVGFFNEAVDLRAVEDYEYWLRIAATFPRGLRSLPKTLAYYRQHELNISRVTSPRALQGRAYVLYHTKAALPKLGKHKSQLLDDAIAVTKENWIRATLEEPPNHTPLVSVVMSVYNGGELLRASIQSILDQLVHNFEFIIIDDGSTDETAALITSYKDPRIRLIQQKNQGLVYSLNRGVREARAPYIARQDADDVSLPTRLREELKILLAEPQVGLVGTYFGYVDENDKRLPITIIGPTKHTDLCRSFYFVNPIGHGTAIFRKDIFEQAGAYNNNYGPTEDFELWRRMAKYGELRQVPDLLYLYRISSESISHQKQETQHAFTAKIIHEQWRKPFISKRLSELLSDAKYYRTLRSAYASAVYTQYLQDQYRIASDLFKQGMIREGFKIMFALVLLNRSIAIKLVRPSLSGILRSLGLREKGKL